MNPTYDFPGQVALVTGAGSGMGLATAQAFAEAGAAVVLADINDQTLRAATDELTSAGPSGARRHLRRVRRGAGRRPGRAHRRHLRPARLRVQQRRHPGPADRRRRRTGRDLRPRERDQPARRLGLHEARAAADARARQRRHRQLLLARRPGRTAGRAAYHASKHGVIGLTKSAALEYAPAGSASTRSARGRSRPRWSPT